MNSYFQVDASSSKARIMVKLAEMSTGVTLDDRIIEMAATGRIVVSEAYKQHEDVVQDIIDYGFRCVIPGNYDTTAELIIEAATKADKRIVFLCKQPSVLYWKKFFKAYRENTGVEPNAEAITVCDDDLLESDYINAIVDAVVVIEDDLIINGGGAYGNISNLVFSVSQIVVLQSPFNYDRLNKVTRALFTNGPSDILTSTLARRALEVRGFKSTKIRDILFLLNTVNKFID